MTSNHAHRNRSDKVKQKERQRQIEIYADMAVKAATKKEQALELVAEADTEMQAAAQALKNVLAEE